MSEVPLYSLPRVFYIPAVFSLFETLNHESGVQQVRSKEQRRVLSLVRILPPPEDFTKTHSEIHTHALRLRLDGHFGYKLNGRMDLALYSPEICADARADAARSLKAPIMNQVFNNYGAKSNSELLFSFGFCLRPNPSDVVIVSLGYIYFTCITKPVNVLLLVSVGYIYCKCIIKPVHDKAGTYYCSKMLLSFGFCLRLNPSDVVVVSLG